MSQIEAKDLQEHRTRRQYSLAIPQVYRHVTARSADRRYHLFYRLVRFDHCILLLRYGRRFSTSHGARIQHPALGTQHPSGPLRPHARARRLRRRVRRRHQRAQVARDRPAGAAGPEEPAAPRRLRLRGQHRRRRRHPRADAGRVSAEGRTGCSCPRRGSTAPASSSCRSDAGASRSPRAAGRADRRRGGTAPARLARRADRRLAGRPERGRGRAACSEQMFVGAARLRLCARRPRTLGVRVRAQAVRHPQAHRARGRRPAFRMRARKLFYIVSLSCEHADLQGHADRRPDRDDVPRSDAIRTSSRRWRSCTSGSARTRSRRGRWRIRTASSRTTARSTR